YNQDYYLWATRVTRKLLDVLNQLVLFYNASGFVNEDDYHDTSQIINWWIPHTLKVSSAYFDNLQSNYDTANKLLDELENYAEINRERREKMAAPNTRVVLDLLRDTKTTIDLTPYFQGRVGDSDSFLPMAIIAAGRAYDLTGKSVIFQ